MCYIIKNGNVTTSNGSHKGSVAVKDGQIIKSCDYIEAPKVRVIDASKMVSGSIVNWFTSL
ncbi:hypothetical protein Halha_0811 [Halobacteroides halobius DSM 5150]|uniref:Uncharacterized protein n=1 Tax=Halobacteroides halobius (strain ATCC 35273 / DSM 5150 / MD-1) TaxID=748449 RepID=L0K6B3_HALHC|nr:hypothetical protein [Halobacteroides halobius]AGB40782.1 hypothetical protein Halha_0811 [Halobacteroides halobius DSM 5150]